MDKKNIEIVWYFSDHFYLQAKVGGTVGEYMTCLQGGGDLLVIHISHSNKLDESIHAFFKYEI